MPPVASTKISTFRRFQPYYAPPVYGSLFPPERLLTPPPMSSDLLYSAETHKAESLPKWVSETPSSNRLAASPEQPILPDTRRETRSNARFETDSAGVIPKPPGEAGKPKNGGYTVQVALGWTTDQWKEARSFVKPYLDANLLKAGGITKQDRKYVTQIIAELEEKIPYLKRCEKHWGARDIISSVTHISKKMN